MVSSEEMMATGDRLVARPKGFFGRFYDLRANEQSLGELTIGYPYSGSIQIGEQTLEVTADGAAAGGWALLRCGVERASARRIDLFSNSFCVRSDGHKYVAEERLMPQGFRVRDSKTSNEVARISGPGPIRSKVVVEIDLHLPLQVTCFLAFSAIYMEYQAMDWSDPSG